MNLSVNIKYLAKSIGMENAARLLSEAGFRFLDYTPDVTADWEMEINNAADIFHKYNLSVYQTHAPYNRYKNDNVETHKRYVENSLYASSKLNAKYMVVHGDEFDFESMQYSSSKALKYNYDYYAPIVDKAKSLNVNIAFENLFEGNFGKPRYCSKVEELIELISKYNSENVCACWDFGHGAVSYKEEQSKAIETLGKRLCCTHVHDNYLYDDAHLVPYLGSINWAECIGALKQFSNVDILSYELVYGNIPKAIAKEYTQMLYKVGAELMSI